jgi:hypothetical protein
MEQKQIEKAINDVYDKWRSLKENRHTLAVLEFTDSDTKGVYAIIEDAIKLFVSQQKL